MSFYTALTGLKGAQTDISTTSNNIANVGSNGFKKSRAEFGDIYGSTPLQAKSVGVGTLTKSITQQFSQGNIATSSNSLDMAISGQGFFALQAGGNAQQTVYTRNGAFNVDDTGFIVDSNGQFLLGYPVDDDGAVSDKTLAGANKLQLKSEYGAPKQTGNIMMGVNLASDTPALPADNIFDANDPDTYTSNSSVTIFDSAGNPQSATVFYLKTQNATDADPTFKYDTKLIVDGLEITPQLTRAVNPQEAALYIDKFGQQTTVPQDPAYILEGKGFPLYKADDLGAAVESTPAVLRSNGIETFLGEGRTVEIVTDPLKFKSTREFQTLSNVASPTGSTFWGKDFLLIDVDNSGPVSIDIPPGTYNGTQLAAAVEIATRNAFGDDRKIRLTDNVDNKFNIDLKITSGDGLSTGLTTPIEVDLHQASFVNSAAEARAGMTLDNFLSHAQVRTNDAMNAYVQATGSAAGVNAANVTALGADGRLFKKLVGTAIPNTAIPAAGIPAARISGNDIATVTQLTNNTVGSDAVTTNTRYVAYSNDATGTEANKPSVKAYDNNVAAVLTTGTFGIHAAGTTHAGKPYFEVPQTGFTLTPETVRFMQFPAPGKTTTLLTNTFGDKDITVVAVSAADASDTANNYRVTLDVVLPAATTWPASGTNELAAELPVSVLAKPSDHIVAYFEDTAGLVEGVDEVYTSSKIVIQEIGASALRTAAQITTANTGGGINALSIGATLASNQAASTLGLAAGVLSTNWVDDRDPAIKIGYDEQEQRLTFDGDNAQLGLGTGIGMNNFTVYSQVLAAGTNGVGIQAYGNNSDISLATDDKAIGNSFVADGPQLQAQNKRFGMEVNFDTVNNSFEFKSGSTGEALAANSAQGVAANQSMSDVAVGRYGLTILGERDPTDAAEYSAHKIGTGTNQVLGFPREGEVGYTAATGIISTPAVATGAEALVDMQNAFTLTTAGNENRFNIVVNGVSAFIELPERNYTGITMATALESRINQMKHPVTGQPVGGVDVTYNAATNNLVFTTGTTGDSSTFKIEGALRFGLQDIPLGIGNTTEIKTPVQATDNLGRPLFVSPTGEITTRTDDFADNIVEDFYPLYLDDGELTFNKAGELISPITKVSYDGLPNANITVDFSEATQLAQPFSAQNVSQDGAASGRLTNLEIDNYGNVLAGYSNGENVSLGKIIIANFSNNSGLKQIGNSTFTSTAASGDPELGEAAEDGFGNILSGSLERSNVDITEELVNLITAQRNYQAAAKAMETTTSMTQTIINIRL
ncbi:flagellar hook-basal body complex protein [Planktomarina temperata]|nr:flagellar hook-basal body complex protein [Planktomarina temperata]